MFSRYKKMIQVFSLTAIIVGTVGVKDYTLAAERNITVLMDQETISFPDARPTLENGRVSIPVRAVTENMGLKVDWNSKTQTVEFSNGTDTVKLEINKKATYKNGKFLTDLDVPPKVVKERTYVPLRFIAEAFGAKVDWVSKESLVNITLNGSTPTPVQTGTLQKTGNKAVDAMLPIIERTLDNPSIEYDAQFESLAISENGEHLSILNGRDGVLTISTGDFKKSSNIVKMMAEAIVARGVPAKAKDLEAKILSDYNNGKAERPMYGNYYVEIAPRGQALTIRVLK